jgi:hypothetical protein
MILLSRTIRGSTNVAMQGGSSGNHLFKDIGAASAMTFGAFKVNGSTMKIGWVTKLLTHKFLIFINCLALLRELEDNLELQ